MRRWSPPPTTKLASLSSTSTIPPASPSRCLVHSPGTAFPPPFPPSNHHLWCALTTPPPFLHVVLSPLHRLPLVVWGILSPLLLIRGVFSPLLPLLIRGVLSHLRVLPRSSACARPSEHSRVASPARDAPPNRLPQRAPWRRPPPPPQPSQLASLIRSHARELQPLHHPSTDGRWRRVHLHSFPGGGACEPFHLPTFPPYLPGGEEEAAATIEARLSLSASHRASWQAHQRAWREGRRRCEQAASGYGFSWHGGGHLRRGARHSPALLHRWEGEGGLAGGRGGGE